MNIFEPGQTITVNNKMQRGEFLLSAPIGGTALTSTLPPFAPALTPPEMLSLGIFGGKYMTDCEAEYPDVMFAHAKLSPLHSDPKGINLFGVRSGDGLSEWRERGWINEQDPRGWFEWYSRFWIGRRSADDYRQILRWSRFGSRWTGQVISKGRLCGQALRQAASRQSLLHWAYDPLPDFPNLDGETTMQKLTRLLVP